MKQKAIKVAVIGHRADSKRAKAHQIIVRAGGRKADPKKTIAKIRALRVKPSTAASWFYDMRRSRPREQRAS